MAMTPRASTWGVWLSVPTQVSGKATPRPARAWPGSAAPGVAGLTWITGDIFSRLIWCMMPLPAGMTSTF